MRAHERKVVVNYFDGREPFTDSMPDDHVEMFVEAQNVELVRSVWVDSEVFTFVNGEWVS